MNIVTLAQSVCCYFAAALAMRSRIRQQNAVASVEEHRSKSGDTFAIVLHSMEQYDVPSVRVLRTKVPRVQARPVGRRDLNILKLGTKTGTRDLCCLCRVDKRTPPWMQLEFG
jgi:hypothetical protein